MTTIRGPIYYYAIMTLEMLDNNLYEQYRSPVAYKAQQSFTTSYYFSPAEKHTSQYANQ